MFTFELLFGGILGRLLDGVLGRLFGDRVRRETGERLAELSQARSEGKPFSTNLGIALFAHEPGKVRAVRVFAKGVLRITPTSLMWEPRRLKHKSRDLTPAVISSARPMPVGGSRGRAQTLILQVDDRRVDICVRGLDLPVLYFGLEQAGRSKMHDQSPPLDSA